MITLSIDNAYAANYVQRNTRNSAQDNLAGGNFAGVAQDNYRNYPQVNSVTRSDGGVDQANTQATDQINNAQLNHGNVGQTNVDDGAYQSNAADFNSPSTLPVQRNTDVGGQQNTASGNTN